MIQVNASTNMKELEMIMTAIKPKVGAEAMQAYQSERDSMTQLIDQGSFSQVVKRRSRLEQFIQGLDQNTAVIKRAATQGAARAHLILKVNEISKETIGKRISNIVENCLEIDVRGVDDTKRQRTESLDSERQRQQAEMYAKYMQQKQELVKAAELADTKKKQEAA